MDGECQKKRWSWRNYFRYLQDYLYKPGYLIMKFGKCIIFSLLAISTLFANGEPASEKDVAGAIKHITANTTSILSTETTYYSPELLNLGVNGMVLLSGKILKTGEVVSLEVKESSGTKELDESAKRYIIANTEKKERGYELSVDFPVEFSRNFSLDALHKPNCTEIAKDAAYFKKNFPNKKLSNTRYMNAVFGTIMVANIAKPRRKEGVSDELAIELALAACHKDENQPFFFLVFKALYDLNEAATFSGQ